VSRSATVDLAFGDDEHRFRLAIGQLEELQEKTGVSPFTLLARLVAMQPMVRDAREVIRIGLIGGGMAPAAALALTRRYADERPMAESIPAATTILSAALFGVADEEPGKDAEATPAGATPPPIS